MPAAGWAEANPDGLIPGKTSMQWRNRRARKLLRVGLWLGVILLLGLGFRFLLGELRTSRRQAGIFAGLADRLVFELGPGPNPSPLPAPSGPYDKRLGYALLPDLSRKLQDKGFVIREQARVSGPMETLTGWGVFPIYREKSVSGLMILDRDGRDVYSRVYPARVFASFSDIPPGIVEMLLFIENRELLDARRPYLNPAVEWGRLGKAILDKAIQVIEPERSVPGGSTMATQMEKFRHSEDGITRSGTDKLDQMISASLRSYLDGKNTFETRKRIVRDYLNSVPLAARPDYGEISGLGDGLWAWYGAELEDVVPLFWMNGHECAPEACGKKALALKQVLSLFVAHKRPTDYLLKNRASLEKQCDSHLRLLAGHGIIPGKIAELALAAPLAIRTGPLPAPPMTLVERKAASAVRTRLLSLLDLEKLYDLDRLDLMVASTLDLPAQVAITRQIMRLHDPDWVAGHGLRGFRLLEKGDITRVIYSLTLYERTPHGNVLRVQTDNYDQPLNINEGVKLDLGSTAKLRALISYLEIIASLHAFYGAMSPKELLAVEASPQERLSAWAVSYLLAAPDRSLAAMLRAALDRTYAANPHEQFYTGGGLHTFENFDHADDAKVLSVRDGLKDSVNLVFIRLMRDVVRHHMYSETTGAGKLLVNSRDPQRGEYLAKFADYEGSKFVRGFFHKYRKKDPNEALMALLQSVRPVPGRIVAAYRSVVPEGDYAGFLKFLKSRLPESGLSDKVSRSLFDKVAPGKYGLADRGYLARMHPLELWVAAYLHEHPEAGLEEGLRESAPARQEVYSWLFRPSQKGAQNKRIKIMLEIEAFGKLHQSWKRLGYPFDSLVPSYATAIGSSGDRPASLTELMGIILNDGVRLPTYRIEELHFAGETPYEVRFVREPEEGERVLPREIAQVVREALYAVVERGTAVRANRALVRPDGSVIRIGGKTGTGDHRYETFGSDGHLLTSRVVNRSSVFSFIIGDRFFGTITAYVPGPIAAAYGFTSSLPVAILRLLAPQLMPLLDSAPGETARGQDPEGQTAPPPAVPPPPG